ncbi:ACP phosphodiesterase [Vibrio nigripulchritudo]|uniref:acyl carrier protein phosphodiesterase n=1 Tax=Vibrio nigripulchritudo TaxID=28173 RepID=UPI0003B1DB34|nr:ACP phosphodiesterase [Vibrio nigripulchritudo]CCN68409.1 putative Acyl carrier protein phosphodiesterase [Vibrio nigripulchritudo SFn118]
MNYLAHLHIADFCKSNLLGNLLGDFVKGSPDGRFQQDIVNGIKLHRFVDSYTDTHPIVKDLKPLFPDELKRFSPIALDMFWDHCLARHWKHHHNMSLSEFCLYAESDVKSEETDELPERFLTVSGYMWEGQWLLSYAELSNIQFALKRMAMRRPRLASLSECGATLESEYKALNQAFHTLYPDVLNNAKAFYSSL